MKTWAVVASGARARIFEAPGRHQPLKEVVDLVNPEERLFQQDFDSDKPGRAFDRMGGQRHAVETAVDPKEQHAIRFARELVEKLEENLYRKRFDTLCLFAPPHFLGLVRGQMSDALTRTVKDEVNKDFTREDAKTIQTYVDELL